MKARKPFILLLLVTAALAALPSLRGVAVAWAPDKVVTPGAVPASVATVATAAFAVG